MPNSVSEDHITQEYMCEFCLETTVEAAASYEEVEAPTICPHCKTTRCEECRTIIKGNQACCHSCGEIAPGQTSNMVRVDSTAAGYADRNWKYHTQAWDNDIFQHSVFGVWVDFSTREAALKETQPTEEEGREVTVHRVLKGAELDAFKKRLEKDPTPETHSTSEA